MGAQTVGQSQDASNPPGKAVPCSQKATRKPPSSTETPPKRFASNPIDERISFADALKNQHQKISPTQPENPQRIIPTNEDLNSLTKIINIVKEFSTLFQSLGGIDSLYDKLQNSNSQDKKNEGAFNPSKPSNVINNSLSEAQGTKLFFPLPQ
ncbi:hypothetical protein CEXT_699681 [Caerostris extrusa]|uniref:Uncharacterized protein n=1 Tax=Caerostris extrusa TaxID=172846 RepID=A0AAV4TA26_CAEEX|nr:hypothetical protein CEXT_699681 [Caerostris extrusa]